ncbi:DUF362 domain-containing protein [Candidatus Latescibacterota bacterium]
MKRRDFLNSVGTLSAASALAPQVVFGRALQSARYFDLHPFVAAHPGAVFAVRTNVPTRGDQPAKHAVGLNLGRQLFVTSDSDGMPLSTRIALKPNLTCLNGDATEDRLGIVTDPDFTQGFIEGMMSVGLEGGQFYMREGNLLRDGYCPTNQALDWYRPIAAATGAHLIDFDSGRDMTARGVSRTNLEEGSEVIWRDLPDGIIFQRIGYVAPINAPDAFNINLAKFKAHGMGLTLCCKNWQGTNISPYVHYCSSVPDQVGDGLPDSDLNPTYRTDIQALHEQHLEAAVPRWDRPGNIDSWNSGPGMETWSQKTLDNHSASTGGLHVIEGIYGRDGNWMTGPHDGSSQDFMTNVVLFGLNPFKVDVVAYWLGGHEPGNVGLFHAALDRGLTDRLNPHDIPLYAWNDGAPQSTLLDTFERTPLMTYYLQRNYGGQSEPKWHLLDEPYEYDPFTAVEETADGRPQAYVLGQNYPNPFNPGTTIELSLPRDSHVRVEILNSAGQVVDVLVDGWRTAGSHPLTWDAGHRASGTYFYRLTAPGFQQSRQMVLVR